MYRITGRRAYSNGLSGYLLLVTGSRPQPSNRLSGFCLTGFQYELYRDGNRWKRLHCLVFCVITSSSPTLCVYPTTCYLGLPGRLYSVYNHSNGCNKRIFVNYTACRQWFFRQCL